MKKLLKVVAVVSVGAVRALGRRLKPILVATLNAARTQAPRLLAIIPIILQGGIEGVAQNISNALGSIGLLMATMGAAYFGVGVIFKYGPFASHWMKETGGRMLDQSFIVAALTALGLLLWAFAGQLATEIFGQGEAPSVGGPWEPPSVGG